MKDRETLHYFRIFFKLNIVTVAQLVESCATVFCAIRRVFQNSQAVRPEGGSYNIVVFLTICISYANNCFTL